MNYIKMVLRNPINFLLVTLYLTNCFLLYTKPSLILAFTNGFMIMALIEIFFQHLLKKRHKKYLEHLADMSQAESVTVIKEGKITNYDKDHDYLEGFRDAATYIRRLRE